MQLPRSAVENPQATLVVFLLLVILGAGGTCSMPRSEDPMIDFHGATAYVVYPGASPADIESLVVEPVERWVREIDDLTHVQSRIESGRVEFIFEWSSEPDLEEVRRELREAFHGASTEFPERASASRLFLADTKSVNVMQLALASPTASYRELRLEAERLEHSLERVPGVRAIDLEGVQREVVRVSVLPEALARRGLSVEAVVSAIRTTNENVPAGVVAVGERAFDLRTTGSYRSLDEIRRTPLLSAAGQLIPLRDVAEVDFAYEEPTYRARYDGMPAVFVVLRQTDAANLLAMAEALHREVDRHRATLPPHLTVDVVFDQSESVESRIGTFLSSLAQGMVCVSLVIWLSLGLRFAAIVVATVPLSFVIALGFVQLLGYGLHQMTIVALVISLGLLVDNAIVVVESIRRGLASGVPAVQAAWQGAQELASAVASSTLTTVLAFLPLALMADSSGDYIRSMPVTVMIVLATSLLVALTLVPLASSRFLSRGAGTGPIHALLDRLARNGYTRALRSALARPLTALAPVCVVFVASFALFPLIGFSFFPKAEKPHFVVDVRLPQTAGLAATDRAIAWVEQELRKHDAIRHVAANVGMANPRIYYNHGREDRKRSYGQVLVAVDPDRTDAIPALIATLRARFRDYAGARLSVIELQQGPPSEAPVLVRIWGEDIDTLEEIAGDVERVVAAVPGAVSVSNPLGARAIDLKIDVDLEKAGLLGVRSSDLDFALQAAVAGVSAGTYRDTRGDTYDIEVRLPLMDGSPGSPRDAPAWGFAHGQLDRIHVAAAGGHQVPLAQVAELRLEPGPPIIMHRNERRFAVVRSHANGITADALTEAIRSRLSEVQLPPGYTIDFGGESEVRGDSFASLYRALIAALVAIFGVLVFQFRSFSQPLIVYSAVPLALVGALVGLWLSGNTFSFSAFLGLTALIGIVVNNSILLVDAGNRLVERHGDLRSGLIEAASQRLVPILLTTVTTIAGLLPLTLTGDALWSPLGWTLIGGLSLSSVVTLFVTPVLHEQIARRSERSTPLRARNAARAGAVALALSIGAGNLSCGSEPAETRPEPLAVEIALVERARIEEPVVASGRLQGWRSATISFRAGGEVEAVFIEESSRVEKGELVIQLRDVEARAHLVEAEAAHEAALNELERVRRLREADAASSARLERLELETKRARSRLVIARAALADTRVLAPFSGHLTKHHIEAHELARQGSPAFEVADYTPTIVASLVVPADEIPRIRIGDRTASSVEAIPERVFTGRVSLTAVAADTPSGMFRVEVELANPDGVLKPGMIARTVLHSEGRSDRELLTIPVRALVEADSDFGMVYRVVDGVARATELRLGPIAGERIAVLDGLSEGMAVIVEGWAYAKEGMLVRTSAAPTLAQFGH